MKKVLVMLADILEQVRTRKCQFQHEQPPAITFVKEAAKPAVSNKIRASLLQLAQAWELLEDLKFHFPDVIHTTLR